MRPKRVTVVLPLLLLGACSAAQTRPASSASASPAAPAITEVAEGGVVPPGRYAVPFEAVDEEVAWVEVDIPDGFQVFNESVLWAHDDRPSRGLLFWSVTGVNRRPCHGPFPPEFVDPGPSVEDLAAALHQQPHREGAPPEPVTFDGYDGLYLELRLPRNLDTEDCESGSYEAWQAIDTETHVEEERYQYGAGSVDRIWVLDVDGHRLMVNATYDPQMTRPDAAALQSMLDSITIRSGDSG
jgi:hypothetical protein